MKNLLVIWLNCYELKTNIQRSLKYRTQKEKQKERENVQTKNLCADEFE